MTASPSRAYRSKLEVLRDFLRAAREPAPKTRIIGAANLNPSSFRRYLSVCQEHDLVVSVSGGYVATPRASPILAAIDDLLGKREEIERAYQTLCQRTLDGRLPTVSASPFRHVLRDAWNEISLQSPSPLGGGRTEVAYPSLASATVGSVASRSGGVMLVASRPSGPPPSGRTRPPSSSSAAPLVRPRSKARR